MERWGGGGIKFMYMTSQASFIATITYSHCLGKIDEHLSRDYNLKTPSTGMSEVTR